MPFAKLCVEKFSSSIMKLNYSNFNVLQVSKLSTYLVNSTTLNSTFSRYQDPTVHRNISTVRPQNITKDDKRDFMAVFPDIVREIVQLNPQIPDLTTLLPKLLQYNVSGGKKARGLSVVHSYRMLAPDSEYTPENIRLSQILGWCVEMVQGFLLCMDDLTDQSETRRGKLCWYKLPDVGLRACSDSLLIQAALFQLIKHHCQQKPYYLELVELFLDTIRRTSIGQTIDLLSVSSKLSSLTMDRLNFIHKFKTAYYTYHLPVATAMYMSGIYNQELHRQAESVLLEMGLYFQVQDDFLDVYTPEEVSGKKGTDIQDGKCTWLVIIAFQRASPSQRAILEECYGSKDPEKIKKVIDLFNELGIPNIYAAYEESACNLITKQIQQLSQGLPHELFLTLLHKTHGRKA